ncbi:hypothetical protein KXD93_12895 [Mucilaginibacter sp. BJC16-A38]|uniref:tectonin domain-containing protein n=1 Tax=Mucilaginibacter phenanthrenivorans TaxID=1234842 RepID=UPI0021583573|nr:tectonin domain-containing protein [Mucilaginibacter phenanthrenivorans]MCR8558546.1 hypothetical protein [Mucilaginibacter phenanthrenivorans]
MKKIRIACLLFAVANIFIACKKESSPIKTDSSFSKKLTGSQANLPSSDNWLQLPGAGTDVGIGANGSVFITDTTTVSPTGGYGILKWNGSSWTTFSGAAVRLAVDPQGNPWVINKSHLIFKFNGSAFQQLPGTGTDIGIGADGSVFITDTTTVSSTGGFRVSKWNGTSWVVISGASGVRVAVDQSGTPWVVNKSNLIYKYNGTMFQQVAGSATDIGIGANGSVYIVGTTLVSTSGGYGISKWNGTGWTATVSGAGINVAVDPQGHPWTVNASHLIYNNLNL